MRYYVFVNKILYYYRGLQFFLLTGKSAITNKKSTIQGAIFYW